MSTPSIAIGTIHVPAGSIHDASYETAAWYRTFVHPAQTCTIYMNPHRPETVSYTIQGTTTYEYFPSLFGGVPVGGGTIGECSKPSTYVVHPYNYYAAERAEAGEITLSPDVEIQETYFDHPVSCRGYSTVYVDGKPTYVACPHDVHEDAHYRPTLTERNERGFLKFGYVPGVKDRKRHIKIVPKQVVS